MSKINFTMGNVSSVAVSPINADATVRQGNANNSLVFAGIVVSQKGAPYEVITVNKGNWQDKLGKPYHSSFGVHADSMRSLGEAVDGGDGIVVRIVPSAATYPAIKVSKPDAEVVVANEVLAYGADLTLQSGEFLALAIKDGANSDKRTVHIEAADETLYGSDMFILTLKEELAAGGTETLEEHVVSFDPEATDSMGAAAFIETVIESKSGYLTCVVDSLAAKAALTELPETAFTGASNGDLSDITTADYDKAIEVLRNTVVGYNYVVGLSCYDAAVQANLIGIMNDRRISGAFDINPRLTNAEGLAAKKALNLNEPRANYTHFPYTSVCPYHGNRVMFGLSGTVYKAKAKGVAKTSPIGGWHYTPAGVDRAVISRAGLAPMKNLDAPDYEAMYKARLNKLAVSENGNLFIDDSLTSCAQENYLRFEQVVSVMDAISRDFYALANRLKHQPDGITREGLEDGMKAIGEGYQSVDAIVPPRNPDQDGEEGFVYKVEQVEIDLWKITWSVCVTGSGRRFIGEPILVR